MVSPAVCAFVEVIARACLVPGGSLAIQVLIFVGVAFCLIAFTRDAFIAN